MAEPYKPTKGDLAYRDAVRGDINPFDEAKLLRKVSHEYLAVLAHDNASARSHGMTSLVAAERQRRDGDVARRATWAAIVSAAFAGMAFVVSILALLKGE